MKMLETAKRATRGFIASPLSHTNSRATSPQRPTAITAIADAMTIAANTSHGSVDALCFGLRERRVEGWPSLVRGVMGGRLLTRVGDAEPGGRSVGAIGRRVGATGGRVGATAGGSFVETPSEASVASRLAA